MSREGEENEQKQAGGRSLRRAFSLLEAVAATPAGMSLGELAKAAELHTSTTFHLLKTLLSLGYVRRDEATKRYFVGSRLFALAAGAADEVELINVCTPVLESLAADTGETSHLAVRSGSDVATARVQSRLYPFLASPRRCARRRHHRRQRRSDHRYEPGVDQ